MSHLQINDRVLVKPGIPSRHESFVTGQEADIIMRQIERKKMSYLCRWPDPDSPGEYKICWYFRDELKKIGSADVLEPLATKSAIWQMEHILKMNKYQCAERVHALTNRIEMSVKADLPKRYTGAMGELLVMLLALGDYVDVNLFSEAEKFLVANRESTYRQDEHGWVRESPREDIADRMAVMCRSVGLCKEQGECEVVLNDDGDRPFYEFMWGMYPRKINGSVQVRGVQHITVHYNAEQSMGSPVFCSEADAVKFMQLAFVAEDWEQARAVPTKQPKEVDTEDI